MQGVSDRPEGAPAHPRVPSFQEVFRTHAARLFRALVGLGVREADADDVLQEVMLVVHRKLPEFDGRSLESWLYGICLRQASDYRRSARVRRELAMETVPDAMLDPPQAGQSDARRLEQRLLAVLDELDDDKRAAFVLFEIEERKLREVAEAMGCPLQTAYSRLQVARDHVRRAFTELSPAASREAG